MVSMYYCDLYYIFFYVAFPSLYNLDQIFALKMVITLSTEKGAQKIQIFGDSHVVVNWVNVIDNLENFTLSLIFEEVQLARTTFNNILIHHVF
jgi:hypothetical protein